MEMKETNTKNEVGKKDKEVRKIPAFGGKGPSRIRQSFGRGLTIFLVIAACIILYFAFLRADTLFSVAGTIIEILKPIIYGFAIAYLLNPIVKETDKYLLPVLRKKIKKEKTARQFSRAAGILFALLVLFAVIFALLNMLIPELFHSIRNLMETLPGQLNSGIEAIENLQKEQSTMGLLLGNILNHASETLQNWIQTDLLRQMNIWMTNITTGAMNVLSEVFNFLVGCIVSVYMLFSKELFAAQMKKILYGVMSIEHANMTLHITRKSNEIFGGFIIGKIIDSAIIGVLCFLGLTLLDMPYILLVSVIVGVTNVIPFFGPYIGAIPSAILIALADPIKGIYFLIFILALQQLDGNVIGPKILGDSTGLSAFWVVFSILLGGGLFGFVGMIAGVPTFAVIYYIVKMVVEQKLEKKKMPADTEAYGRVEYLDDNGTFQYVKDDIKERTEDADSSTK
ncbi:AI-2E family transporter [Sellimonas intestinalis]|jgi:predicted PurR-regulated permease PerM|uniref:AI-2E family transporter n=2 Tax=Sellimonas intestinalis TaxID=1653434 RepID=A0A3E3K556_9FIRM|nr:AI-2E family transporter [Sellimonas intestinalis]KYG88595.1 hypothetical protein AXF09_00295 [Ruminococcus sp. DSM 100440]PWM93126.1 MAG: AI-2E family transporter [Ruminococcus sp.]MBA2212818.1 AI-2E family transporter [Sellimonas intestinalis]MTS22450.1 AI-2E family transporter [Sellimonas intestinalis]NSJ24566.1 AI-2E family transporter [Sellimonas intestinalis]